MRNFTKNIKMKKIIKRTLISIFLLIILLFVYIKYTEYRLNKIVTVNKDIPIDSLRKHIRPDVKKLLDSLENLP